MDERFLGITGSGIWRVTNVGDEIKVKITDIREITSAFYIDYEGWMDSYPYEWIGTQDLYKDPSDYHLIIRFLALTPVSNYLAEYAETNTGVYSPGVLSSSENVLTERAGPMGPYNEYWQRLIEFDSNGIASKMQFSIDATVLYVLTRTEKILGYDLLMLIGLTVIAGVSVSYIMRKKIKTILLNT